MNKYTDNKVYFIDGEEFGPEADVTITVVVNVLYGLKSTGELFHNHVERNPRGVFGYQ